MKYYQKLWKHEKYFYMILMIVYLLVTLAVCNLTKQYKEYINGSPYPVFIGYVVVLEFLKNYSKSNEAARSFIKTLPVKKFHIETFHYVLGVLTFLPSMLLYLYRIRSFAPLLEKEIFAAMAAAILFFAAVQIVKLLLKKEILALILCMFLYLCTIGKLGSILANIGEFLYYFYYGILHGR